MTNAGCSSTQEADGIQAFRSKRRPRFPNGRARTLDCHGQANYESEEAVAEIG